MKIERSQISWWQQLLAIIVGLVAVLLIFPAGFYGYAGNGLDPSWQIALHLAYDQGRIFGRDFIFTYGPLGWVSTRLPFEGVTTPLLIHDLLLLLNVFVLVWHTQRVGRSVMVAIATVVAVMLLGGTVFYHDLSMVWSLVLLFHLIRYLDSGRVWNILAAGLVAVFLFYLKLNSGLVGTILLFCTLGAFHLAQGSIRRGLVLGAGQIALLLASTVVLPVALIDYWRASVHIASGYNDAMFSTPHDDAFYGALSGCLLFLLALGWRIVAGLRLPWRERLIEATKVFCAGATLFVIFKQAFVRGEDHYVIFFQFALIPAALLAYSAGSFWRRPMALASLGTLGICWWMLPQNVTWSAFPGRVQGAEEYFADFADWTHDRGGLMGTPEGSGLPREILDPIGKGSVDVIPWNISFAFRNRLTYEPRPVMQSYSAYDAYLDGLNAAKYAGSTAPDALIFSLQCVDSRYCLFDETQTKLEMLKRYDVTTTYADLVLLRRNSGSTRTVAVEKTSAAHYTLGEEVTVADRPTQLLHATFDVPYSLLGAIRSFFYQPPELRIRLTTKRGVTRDYRAPARILAGGVFLNKYVGDTADARDFFAHKFDRLGDIKSFEIYSPHPWGFRGTIAARYELLQFGER